MDIFYSAVFPACYWSILVSCPSRSLTSSLHLVDSAGRVSEQIPLNPSDYCPYSATGNYTVGGQEVLVSMATTDPLTCPSTGGHGLHGNHSPTHLSVHRGAWSTPTTAVRRTSTG